MLNARYGKNIKTKSQLLEEERKRKELRDKYRISYNSNEYLEEYFMANKLDLSDKLLRKFVFPKKKVLKKILNTRKIKKIEYVPLTEVEGEIEHKGYNVSKSNTIFIETSIIKKSNDSLEKNMKKYNSKIILPKITNKTKQKLLEKNYENSNLKSTSNYQYTSGNSNTISTQFRKELSKGSTSIFEQNKTLQSSTKEISNTDNQLSQRNNTNINNDSFNPDYVSNNNSHLKTNSNLKSNSSNNNTLSNYNDTHNNKKKVNFNKNKNSKEKNNKNKDVVEESKEYSKEEEENSELKNFNFINHHFDSYNNKTLKNQNSAEQLYYINTNEFREINKNIKIINTSKNLNNKLEKNKKNILNNNNTISGNTNTNLDSLSNTNNNNNFNNFNNLNQEKLYKTITIFSNRRTVKRKFTVLHTNQKLPNPIKNFIISSKSLNDNRNTKNGHFCLPNLFGLASFSIFGICEYDSEKRNDLVETNIKDYLLAYFNTINSYSCHYSFNENLIFNALTDNNYEMIKTGINLAIENAEKCFNISISKNFGITLLFFICNEIICANLGNLEGFYLERQKITHIEYLTSNRITYDFNKLRNEIANENLKIKQINLQKEEIKRQEKEKQNDNYYNDESFDEKNDLIKEKNLENLDIKLNEVLENKKNLENQFNNIHFLRVKLNEKIEYFTIATKKFWENSEYKNLFKTIGNNDWNLDYKAEKLYKYKYNIYGNFKENENEKEDEKMYILSYTLVMIEINKDIKNN